MAVEVERMVTLLEARISGFERELKRAPKVADRQAKAIENRFAGMNRKLSLSLRGAVKGINGSLATLGVSLTAVGFVAATRHAIEYADAIAKAADRTGLGVEELQELQHAAQLSGIEGSAFNKILERLNVAIAETARGTGEARKGFELAGVTLRDNDGQVKSNARVLEELAEAISKTESATRRADIVNGIFGQRLGSQLLPLFKDGAAGIAKLRQEARDMGLVLDTAMVREAERAGDSLERLGKIAGVNLTRAMLALAPTIVAVGRAAAAAAPHIATFLSGFLPDSVAPVAELEERLQSLREKGLDLELRRGLFETFGQGSVQRGGLTENDERIRTLEQLLAERRRQEALLNDALSNAGGGSVDPAGDRLAGLEKYIAGLERAAQLEGTADSQRQLHTALLEGEAKLLDENGKLTRELTRAETDRISAAVRAQDRERFTAALQELNVQIQAQERLAAAYAVSDEAGKALESQLAAEIETRKNAEVGVDELALALERERLARERVGAQQTLNASAQQTAGILAEADAVGQATIRWNEYTGAYELYNREALIVAETQRLLASNTQLTAEAARAAATAQVDAADRLAQAQAGANAEVQQMNEYSSLASSSITGLFSAMARGENAVQALGNALSNLAQQLLQLALNQLFLQLLSSAASGAAGGAAGGGGGSGAMLIAHEGGIVGRDVKDLDVAKRLRSGRGRKSNEYLTLLERDEEVLTRDNPRHRFNLDKLPAYHNGGLVGRVPDVSIPRVQRRSAAAAAPVVVPAPNVAVKNVNAFDAASVLSEALSTSAGEKAQINWVRANATAVRGALGIPRGRG